MGMPVHNGNLITVGQNPAVDSSKATNVSKITRQRSSLSTGSYITEKVLDRKLSAPELPPIGIKPHSPSYSSPIQSRQYDSPLELNVDSSVKRTNRRSPLSPTSTTSSHDGSNRSTRLSPGAGGLSRSRTWTGDLSSSQHGNSKLETLYETGAAGQGSVQPGLAKLTITQESKTESKIVPTSTITSPPPIDRHMSIKSTQTITVISASQKTDTNNNSNPLPTPPKNPQLTANRLSQENLKRLRHSSQSSSVSSSMVPIKASSDTGYDTDEEKDHRIVEWLIGIETSKTEQPPDTTGLATTEKRDTAIHIVYEGD